MPSHPLHTRGGIAQGAIRVGSHGDLADGEQIVIGNRTFEWDDNASVSAGAIAVTIGADAAEDIENLVDAVNANFPQDDNSLQLVEAYIDTIDTAVARLKGTRQSAECNVALTTTMAHASNIVSAATLLGGVNDTVQEVASGKRTVSALDVAGGAVVIQLPFDEPRMVQVQAKSATGLIKAITDLVTVVNDAIVIDADGGTNLAATDTVDWLAIK